MNKPAMTGAAAGVLVLIGLVAWWESGQRSQFSAAGDAGGHTVVAIGTPAPASVAPAGVPTAAIGAPAGGAPAGAGLSAIQAELQALTAKGRQPAPLEVDALLAKIEQSQGTSTVGGYDLKVLRNNLQVAERIRGLTDRMQDLAKNPTPENTQKLMALLKEVQQAQAEMRLDFMAQKP